MIMYSPISLPYSVNELEPYIDGETVMIHYGKHYMNYLRQKLQQQIIAL